MNKSQRSVTGVVVASFLLAALTAGMVQWWIARLGIEPPVPPNPLAAHAHEGGRTAPAVADVTDPTQVLNLAVAEAPVLKVTMRPAADGGWDVRLEVQNFRFAAANTGEVHVPGTGHAHLFVDGAYIDQIDGPQYHLAPLANGVHEITVGLNALDHRAFARAGELVAERTVVRVAPRGRGAAPSDAKVVELRLSGTRLGTGTNTERVRVGELVQLRWKADADSSLHLHGYDIEADLGPGSPVSMLFIADIAGRFPVEVHGPAGGPATTVFYLEVYP